MHSIIKKTSVRFQASEDDSPSAPTPGGGPRSTAKRCKKSVQLLRLEGVVQALELTCSCGEVTVVELDTTETDRIPETEPES